MDLDQVLDVFKNPHTEALHDRQSAVLRRMMRECADGLRYRQLPVVCELLELIWKRIDGGAAQFVPLLNNVLVLCGLPVVREKSNEEFLGGLENFEALIATMERFLHVPVHSVQIATCKALQEVALGRDAAPRVVVEGTFGVVGAAGDRVHSVHHVRESVISEAEGLECRKRRRRRVRVVGVARRRLANQRQP